MILVTVGSKQGILGATPSQASSSMKSLLQKYSSHKSKRFQRWLEKWARERTKGQARFVIRTTLAYSVLILMLNDFWDGGIGFFTLVTTHLTGIVIGFVAWNVNESRYKNALIEGRVKAAPSGELPEKRHFSSWVVEYQPQINAKKRG